MCNTIRFLTRPGCGLCDKARTTLEPIAARWHLDIIDVDISADPELESEYGWEIPIAFLGKAELFRHYAVDSSINAILRRLLKEGDHEH